MKTNSVVVFGASTFSSLAFFCLTNDSQWTEKHLLLIRDS